MKAGLSVHLDRFGMAAAIVAPLLGGAAWGEVLNFVITLDGMQEVPPVDTDATGNGTATLDTDTGLFSWNITFSGLSSNQTAAHFHGTAPHCVSAGVVIPLDLGSPIVGSQILTPDEMAEVRAGLWYVNVHTTNHPGGEIRGQVEPAPLSDPIPQGITPGNIRIRLETVADGLTAPNWGTAPRGDRDRLFVVDQVGIVWGINLASGDRDVFMDVSDRLVDLGIGGPGSFDERGLLGLAFHPNYFANGLLYTYTSEPVGGEADFSTIPDGAMANHQSVIAEWRVPNPRNGNSVVDPNSRRELMRIDQPQFNHNAGCLNFGHDGMLYIALGDGGAGDDQDGGTDPFDQPILGHGCTGNGQDTNSILGSILRINPLGDNSDNGQYGIPSDNPLVGLPGLDEIWAFGLRNPFRFSFDQVSGRMILTDVGQNDIEEVNLGLAGANYGWNLKEGTFRFVRNGYLPGYVSDRLEGLPAGLVDPIAQYDHDEGISVIGGFVYRSGEMAALNGRYLFGEFARTFDNDGRLFYLNAANQMREFEIVGQDGLGRFLMGFGQDGAGNVYALVNSTGVPFDSTGAVLKIVPEMDLELAGNCPGMTTATVTGATAGGTVALLRAMEPGSTTVPPGQICAGTTLGLSGMVRLVGVATADGEGRAVFSGNVPSIACGRLWLQAVDVASCTGSDAEGL